MAIQFSDDVRNARLDAIETTIGVSPTLEMRSGAVPTNCAAADSGTVLATLTLPSDWMAAAAAGSKALAGTWEDLIADNSGAFGHFRIKASGVCKLQGTAGVSGTDMIVDAASITAGQRFAVTAFTLTDANA